MMEQENTKLQTSVGASHGSHQHQEYGVYHSLLLLVNINMMNIVDHASASPPQPSQSQHQKEHHHHSSPFHFTLLHQHQQHWWLCSTSTNNSSSTQIRFSIGIPPSLLIVITNQQAASSKQVCIGILGVWRVKCQTPNTSRRRRIAHQRRRQMNGYVCWPLTNPQFHCEQVLTNQELH